MKLLRRKKGSIAILGSGIVGAVAVLALASWVANPLGLADPPASPQPAFEDAARAVWRNARVRATLEFAVVVLQVGGVAMLCLSRLHAGSPWADRGRIAFVGAMIGLGVSGIFCAWYGSEFALFAGGTMAILYNVVILGTAHGPSSHTTRQRSAAREVTPAA